MLRGVRLNCPAIYSSCDSKTVSASRVCHVSAAARRFNKAETFRPILDFRTQTILLRAGPSDASPIERQRSPMSKHAARK